MGGGTIIKTSESTLGKKWLASGGKIVGYSAPSVSGKSSGGGGGSGGSTKKTSSTSSYINTDHVSRPGYTTIIDSNGNLVNIKSNAPPGSYSTPGGGHVTYPGLTGVISNPSQQPSNPSQQPVQSTSSNIVTAPPNVTSAAPIGIIAGYNAAKRIIQQDPTTKGFIAAGGKFISTTFANKGETIDQRNQRLKASGERIVYDQPSPSGYGSTSYIRYEEVPNEVLEKSAATGDNTAYEVLVQRRQEDINNAQQKVAASELNKDTQKYNSYVQSQQNLVNQGKISVDEANQNLKNYAGELDNSRGERISNRIDPYVNAQQARLDKIAEYGKISRITLTTAVSVGLGYAATSVISALPSAVRTGVNLAAGATIGYSATKLGKNVVQGNAGLLDVAAFTLPLAGFAVGGGLRARVNTKNLAKLDSALKSPNLQVELKDSKIFTTEGEIKALNLPSDKEGELIAKFNAGRRVGIRVYDIRSTDSAEQKIINKFLPKREIISIGEQQALSNGGEGYISGGYFTRIKVGKIFNKYTELQVSRGSGTFNPQTGRGQITTETIRITPKVSTEENILGAQKLKTIFEKPKVEYILDNGQIKRIVGSKSFTFEGKSISKKQNQILTYKDLVEVFKSEQYKNYPTYKSENIEFQELVGLNIAKAKAQSDEIGFGVIGKEKEFLTKASKGIIKKLPEPIEYDRVLSTRPMKPLEYGKNFEKQFEETAPNFKKSSSRKSSSGLTKSQQKVVEQTEENVNFIDLQQGAVKSNIKQSFSELAQNLNENVNVGLNLGALKTLSRNKAINKNDLTLGDINVLENKLDNKILNENVNLNKVATALKTETKLKNINTQLNKNAVINISNIPAKKIKTSKVPFVLPSFSLGGIGIKRKKSKKKPSYAASLGAAAYQVKPLKITKKQYEQLKKRTYSGFETRPVLEITDDQKKVKKELQKVKF